MVKSGIPETIMIGLNWPSWPRLPMNRMAKVAVAQMNRTLKEDGYVWLGGSGVVGSCTICGEAANGVVRKGWGGPLKFYCRTHYDEEWRGDTEYHDLVKLVREAIHDG